MIDDREPPPSGAAHAVRTTRRRGRMSDAKRAALTDLLPRWGLTAPLLPGALDHAFGRNAPRLLDVGVGTGEASRAWAAAHPDHDVIAVELHRPGVARLLQDLDREGPVNVRVVEADVTRLLAALTGRPDPQHRPDRSGPQARPADPAEPVAHGIKAVRVLFPDPWPKKRHLSRRLVDDWFVTAVADVVPAGGWLHLATDWDDYALQMRLALHHEPRFTVELDASAAEADLLDGDRPARPVTTYERRGLAAGRRVTDLLARR